MLVEVLSLVRHVPEMPGLHPVPARGMTLEPHPVAVLDNTPFGVALTSSPRHVENLLPILSPVNLPLTLVMVSQSGEGVVVSKKPRIVSHTFILSVPGMRLQEGIQTSVLPVGMRPLAPLPDVDCVGVSFGRLAVTSLQLVVEVLESGMPKGADANRTVVLLLDNSLEILDGVLLLPVSDDLDVSLAAHVDIVELLPVALLLTSASLMAIADASPSIGDSLLVVVHFKPNVLLSVVDEKSAMLVPVRHIADSRCHHLYLAATYRESRVHEVSLELSVWNAKLTSWRMSANTSLLRPMNLRLMVLVGFCLKILDTCLKLVNLPIFLL